MNSVMSYSYPEKGELIAALREAAQRFNNLLRSLAPEETAQAMPGMNWTVGDTAAHVLTVVRRALGDQRRSNSPAETAILNDLCLSELAERDLGRIAEMLENDIGIVLTKVFPRTPDDLVFPFHAGSMTTIRPAMAVVLGEFLLHGYDLAAATGRSWQIEPSHAALVWRGIGELLPAWLKPEAVADLNETYLIEFADKAAPLLLQFADGQLTVGSEFINSADYILQVEPEELLLTFVYERKPATDPIIARLNKLFEPI